MGDALKIDLHVHTRRSGHSLLKVEKVASIAKRRGLDAVAITDHDEIDSALELSKLFPTVVGEEISCDEGDIIGLFLTERIGRGPVLEVMDRIRAQGGLVMVPHPFDSLRKEALMNEELCAKGDLIEIFNSRVTKARDNARAAEFAEARGMLPVVGSDAHTAAEIGRSWIEVSSCAGPDLFIKSLPAGRMHTSKSPFYVHLQTKLLKLTEAFH